MQGLTDDPRFATAPDRVRNRDVLVPLVKAVIKQRSRNDWLKRLDDSGVPSGAIRTVAEVCDGGTLEARGMIAEMPHSSAGNVKGIKSAIHLSETALDTYNAPPMLGQHTHEVLTKASRLYQRRRAQVGTRGSNLALMSRPLIARECRLLAQAV
jgi:formyl-CoA transferase